MTQTIPRPLWSFQLQEFTDRNAGRRALLEVDDPRFWRAGHGGLPVARSIELLRERGGTKSYGW